MVIVRQDTPFLVSYEQERNVKFPWLSYGRPSDKYGSSGGTSRDSSTRLILFHLQPCECYEFFLLKPKEATLTFCFSTKTTSKCLYDHYYVADLRLTSSVMPWLGFC